MKTCCMVVLAISIAVPARSQEPRANDPITTPRLIISERAIAAALEEHPTAQPTRRRDSVANGALIGGLLVGVGLAAGGAWVCHMLKEPADPSCWPGILRIGAIGFGIGAGVGIGIDLLLFRAPSRGRHLVSGTEWQQGDALSDAIRCQEPNGGRQCHSVSGTE